MQEIKEKKKTGFGLGEINVHWAPSSDHFGKASMIYDPPSQIPDCFDCTMGSQGIQ